MLRIRGDGKSGRHVPPSAGHWKYHWRPGTSGRIQFASGAVPCRGGLRPVMALPARLLVCRQWQNASIQCRNKKQHSSHCRQQLMSSASPNIRAACVTIFLPLQFFSRSIDPSLCLFNHTSKNLLEKQFTELCAHF